MRIALFEPDIPANTGTLIRLGACLGIALDIIEPCGFPFSAKSFRRAGLDYVDKADVTLHLSWEAFLQSRQPGRLVLLSTRAREPYTAQRFRPDDTLLVGRESAGVPDHVHARADAAVLIPLQPGLRSLNVAIAAAMVAGEALRQTALFPIMRDP